MRDTLLAPDAIPKEIFTIGASKIGPTLASVAADSFLLDEAIAALRAHSLIDRDPRTDTLAVHRLVQAVLRDRLLEPEQHAWAERVVQVISQVFPWPKPANWDLCQRLLPHARTCAEGITQWSLNTIEAANVLYMTANYLRARAAYAEAQHYGEQALAIRRATLGEQHPDTIANLSLIALIDDSRGKYLEAEATQQQVLAIRRATLGEQHPTTASSFRHLALVYDHQGKYPEAETAYRQALAIYQGVWGEQHYDTAACLAVLADMYNAQGKYPEAEVAYQQALAIRREVLGEQHPETAACLVGLASVYTHQGKYSEAEVACSRALVIQR
jgi:tetratricopeptide (TPR) repeat protein